MARKARPDTAASRLLAAQNASLSRGERIDTMTLNAVSRRAPGIDVSDALLSANVTLTIVGASTLALTIHDPDWVLEESGLLDPDDNGRLDAVVVAVDNLRFRLAKYQRSGTQITLTFEDEVWALLRAHRSHLSVSRNAMTRAQFIGKLVREIRVRDVPFYSPDKGATQPRELPDFPDITPSTTTKSAHSYDEKTWAAALLQSLSIEQTAANMQGLVGWERAEGGHWQNDAKYNPLNTTQTMPGSSSINSVGVKAYKSWQQGFEATVKTLHNGHYPGILSALNGGSPSAIANAIDASPWGTASGLIQRSVAGAPSNLHDVSGGGGATTSDSAHQAVRVKSYRFTRGLPGQTENSAQCATRLADEVAWRFFVTGGGAYFETDYSMLQQPASFILDGFDDDGLLSRPDEIEWDHRKLAAGLTFQAVADAWSVHPGGVLAWRNVPKPVEGRWIHETFEFDLLKPVGCTVTLTKPVAPKKEPAPELFVVNIGDGPSGGGGGGGGDPSVGGGVSKAIAWAQSRIGHYAEEFGNNRGSELDALERKFGFTGAPWCAIFATTVLVMGGVTRACRTAAVAQINQWATEGSHGYQKGSRATPEPGDLITFGNDHVGFVEKVSGSTLHTIEGNTSANKVARLTRAKSSGRIVRPQYPQDS